MSSPAPARWKATLRDGLRQGYVALLPLSLLPLANAAPTAYEAPLRAAALLAALLAWLGTTVARPPLPEGIALLAVSHRGQRLGLWELCLLAFVGAAASLYIGFSLQLHDIVYNDGAYYYGVARHMARTGRFEEPIVWHFLRPPQSIVHVPFDYWGCLTSLLLVPPLLLFGATPETALRTMAVISAASVLAFWYLVCFALPLRHRATQLLALVIFAFSPAMDLYRFQPESIAVAQLFLLLSLIAFCRGRFAAAVLCGFGILLARSDGLILFVLIFIAALWQARRAGGAAARRTGQVAVTGVGCLAMYAAWSLLSFGTLTPPAPRILPLLWSYMQVFDFGADHQGNWSEVASQRLTPAYLLDRVRLGLRTLRSIPFAPALDWWLALAAVPAFRLLRNHTAAERTIWILAVAGYFLVVLVSGRGFAPFRTPYTFTPLVILAGAIGLDAILAVMRDRVRTGAGRARALIIGAGVLTLCALLLASLPILTRFPSTSAVPNQRGLPQLDAVLRGEPVATNSPWYVMAYTDSPAVSIPKNGERAIEALLDRYAVRWLVIFPSVKMGASAGAIARILGADQIPLGRYRLERVQNGSGGPVIYRVRAEAGSVSPQP